MVGTVVDCLVDHKFRQPQMGSLVEGIEQGAEGRGQGAAVAYWGTGRGNGQQARA